MAEDFKSDISQHSDDELLEMVNVRFGEYAEAVIESAKRELENRGFELLRTGSDCEVVGPGSITLSPLEENSDQTQLPPETGGRETAPRAAAVNNAPVDFRYKGVGGWLMFFVITLLLFRPLMVCSFLGQYEQLWGPHYDAFPFLKVIRIINIVVTLGTTGLGIYAGVSLLRIRPNAVRVAKSFLVASSIGLILLGPLLLLAELPEQANTAILKELPVDTIKALVYPTVWYLYLSNSKRVATTYSR